MPLEVLAVHGELRQHHGFALADEMVLRCVRAGNVPAARALLLAEAEGVPVGKEPLDELLLAMLDREDVSGRSIFGIDSGPSSRRRCRASSSTQGAAGFMVGIAAPRTRRRRRRRRRLRCSGWAIPRRRAVGRAASADT